MQYKVGDLYGEEELHLLDSQIVYKPVDVDYQYDEIWLFILNMNFIWADQDDDISWETYPCRTAPRNSNSYFMITQINRDFTSLWNVIKKRTLLNCIEDIDSAIVYLYTSELCIPLNDDYNYVPIATYKNGYYIVNKIDMSLYSVDHQQNKISLGNLIDLISGIKRIASFTDVSIIC